MPPTIELWPNGLGYDVGDHHVFTDGRDDRTWWVALFDAGEPAARFTTTYRPQRSWLGVEDEVSAAVAFALQAEPVGAAQ